VFQWESPLEKCETLGKFTQKVLFLDYDKTKKEKTVTLWAQSLGSKVVTLWGHYGNIYFL